MQRDEPLAGGDGERRPGGEPEVRVDDVEALAREAAPEVARGAGVAARPAGGEGVQLDVEVVDAPQRLDLVAHEAAERGRAGEGYMFVTTSARMPRLRTFTESAHVRGQVVASASGSVTPCRAASGPHRTPRWEAADAVSNDGLDPRQRRPPAGASSAGQGTVEYVGLMLLLATLLTGVVAAAAALKGGGIAKEIVDTLKDTISKVGKGAPQ